jgi:hypothetical protein
MPSYGIPSSYVGAEALMLAAVLLIIAAGLAYLGTRLHRPIGVQRTGRAAGILLVLIWILSYLALSTAGLLYYVTAAKQFGNITAPTNPISPITGLLALITFIGIAFLGRHHGLKAALGSAIVGTIAAPMFFELPFDFITIWKNHPPEPAVLFNMILFFPLLSWEISSFALLTWSPLMRISKYTLWSLSGMFFVFAVWALFGFAYPSTPIPLALNVVSKVLSFVAGVTLFLPRSNDQEDLGGPARGKATAAAATTMPAK